jgi:transcriptional regulator with XRE-family HTH domain
VGAWVKARRTSLGLSQGAMIRQLGYVSRNSISNVETGREGLPPKRVYAWADLLQVPREAFFRFVTGENLEFVPLDSPDGELAPAASSAASSPPLREDEVELLAAYRALGPDDQRRAQEGLQKLVDEANAVVSAAVPAVAAKRAAPAKQANRRKDR